MAERKTPDNLFQRLTKLFRSGPSIKRKVKNYSKGDKNASSAVELFKKSHSDVYNSTLSAYGTFDRMARYSDFSEMESTPEIASALDIYSEESCSQDAEGRVLHIHSNNRKIKELLETLFYDTLNVNFNLVMWTRNLCKYGDFFLFNDVSPEYGVINAYPVPITEMEREEGYDKDDPSAVRFRWITQGNIILENWQVSHFRLLGNDAFLPYGSSVLEAARRIWRQLILIEDAMMVYRVVRSPERRVFYIDVGNLPKVKAEQYLKEVMSRYRNKLVYDASTGEVRDDRKFMSMMEDFWLPRGEGGRGTEITTLPGGQNLGELADIEYFQKKLYRALGIPESRIAAEGGFNLGRSSEILRDELKFAKFVGRLRKRFAAMFNDMLKTQLILKNIVTPEDWKQMEDHIQYDFLYDNQFAELKETEMIQGRLGNLAQIEPYIGKYYSTEFVRKRILRQTDQEIEEIDTQIEEEIKNGILPDPSQVDPITGEPLPQEGGDLGAVPEDPNLDAQGQVTDAEYQKDTKTAEI